MANEITYDVDPGYYLNPFTVNMILSSDVQSLQFSVNGGAPSISKYVAYDQSVPPVPFIAVTQDGRGNVVYDGGFPKFYNTYAPSATLEPFDAAVRLIGTCAGGVNAYHYQMLSSRQVTIAAGDKLVYHVFSNDAQIKAGVDGTFSSGSPQWLRGTTLVDQNGVSCHPTSDLSARANGKWYKRTIDLTSQAGRTINEWTIAFENDTAGTYTVFFKDIYILNGSGTIKETLFEKTLDIPGLVNSTTGSVQYSTISKSVVDVRAHLTASFKYFYNALKFIANQTKVAAGNKKVLIIGDAIPGGSYLIKDTVAEGGFGTTLARLGLLCGYQFTYKYRNEWVGGLIDAPLSELEQYCAVIVFSTAYQNANDAYLITQNCRDAMMTYRENGNGIYLITDHGPVINTITEATSSNKGGFFATANAIITGFGAWFSGDYNRTPINVGFLRSTYGDHPLYESMSDSESISAGGSESRVSVATFASVAPSAVGPFAIGAGRTTIQVAAVLTGGRIVTSRVIYYVVDFAVKLIIDGIAKDNGHSTDIGVKNKVPVAVGLIGSLTEASVGTLYRGAVSLATARFDMALGRYYLTFPNDIDMVKFNNNDELRLVLTSPVPMTIAVTVKRFQPTFQLGGNLPEIINALKTWKPTLTPIERVSKMISDISNVYPGLGITYSVEQPKNLKLIKDHFMNTGPTST